VRNSLVKLATTVGVIMPLATAGGVPAGAVGVYFGQPHHGYYGYHGGAPKWHGCRPGWTRQRGVCKPYQPAVGLLPISTKRPPFLRCGSCPMCRFLLVAAFPIICSSSSADSFVFASR
jgi:hypothetical protein